MESKSIFTPTLESKYVNLELWEKIQHIDLQLIIDRLQFKYHWPQKRIKKAIAMYRQFLYIAAVSEDSLSPSKEVDLVWHDHILHTKKYADDCQKTFGYYLHHLPIPSVGFKTKSEGTCKVCEDQRCKACEDARCANRLSKNTTAAKNCHGGCEGGCEVIETPDPDGTQRCFDYKPKISPNNAFCGVEGDGDCRKQDCEGTAMMTKPKKVISFETIIPKFFVLN